VYTKIFEIKYKKNTRPCRTSNAGNPAKCGSERIRIERDMLDFRTGRASIASSPRGLMGLIATSFLGTRAVPGLAPGCGPFPSRLGAAQVSWALALSCTYYYNIYLGFDTTFVSSGASPVTLTPRGGGRNPPTAGAFSKRLISRFRGLLYSQNPRYSATSGAIW